jgi:citrate lyase subunit gamma (acyl carrier protein)
MESSDVFIEAAPGDGLTIELTSIVMNQFGEQIRRTIDAMLQNMGIQNAHISVNDHGALDCVIQARLETALLRAAKEETT